MSMHGAGPQEAQTVAVHVQVIDLEPLLFFLLTIISILCLASFRWLED